MTEGLRNKYRTAVVTGGSGNLGPIWKSTLESWGINVFIIDQPFYDVRDQASLLLAKHNCYQEFGVPDIILNNAAIDPKPKGQSGMHDSFQEIIETNLIGVDNVIKTFVDDMKTHGGGVIINIGSMLGFVAADYRNYEEGFMKPYGYGTSKAGLLGLTRNVGVYYGQWGIRCVLLAFGPVESEHWSLEFRSKLVKTMPLNRFIWKEDCIAGLRFCLESPNLNAREVLIDGGYSAR